MTDLLSGMRLTEGFDPPLSLDEYNVALEVRDRIREALANLTDEQVEAIADQFDLADALFADQPKWAIIRAVLAAAVAGGDQ